MSAPGIFKLNKYPNKDAENKLAQLDRSAIGHIGDLPHVESYQIAEYQTDILTFFKKFRNVFTDTYISNLRYYFKTVNETRLSDRDFNLSWIDSESNIVVCINAILMLY